MLSLSMNTVDLPPDAIDQRAAVFADRPLARISDHIFIREVGQRAVAQHQAVALNHLVGHGGEPEVAAPHLAEQLKLAAAIVDI